MKQVRAINCGAAGMREFNMQPNDISFETALGERVEQMLDACTRCGRCVEVCPSVKPAGIADAKPEDIITGIIDIVRSGEGPQASRQWAQSCMLSGECIKACDEGVNPRFLLAMARVAIAKAEHELPERRRQGVEKYRDLGRDVAVLSRLQLDGEVLERLGQKSAAVTAPAEPPDFVFYTGCNVLKTPHIALLALDIMDALGISYQVMGGPSHCCGIMQLRPGDVEMSGRMATSTVDKMSQAKSGQVISWCPSCYVQFTETTLPTIERQRGARPFEMTPFMRFLDSRLAELTRHLRGRVDMRVALHRHPGVAGVMEAAAKILQAIPGITLVDLKQPAVGLQSASLGVLPAFKRELQLDELRAGSDAGHRCAGNGLSFRTSRTLRARARLAVPYRQPPRTRRREHGPATSGSLQRAQDDAGCRPDRLRMRRPDRAARARREQGARGRRQGDARRPAASLEGQRVTDVPKGPSRPPSSLRLVDIPEDRRHRTVEHA